ncbi:hypothetical protein HF325_000425 [Metschnikowia pulcherrima]|uniref:MutL C-terminal dimerisation domain-containing protein n=1 Tax=Metschnikowia pulcherrima TaxID=27326 RepID=A0A8H7GWY8_9ASCO|nr:hypothetical protein HF325_000425 [Metschnikowia pulcherrima]
MPSVEHVVGGLLQNALDAGASSFAVKIDMDSLSICVEDDGPGIPSSALRHVGKQYYTTRPISDIDDFEKSTNLTTLLGLVYLHARATPGHIGETLFNIADQCSKLVLVSKCDGSSDFEVLNGQNSTSLKDILMSFFEAEEPSHGTIVIISRLFCNTPVRLKYYREQNRKHMLLRRLKSMIFQLLAHRNINAVSLSFREDGMLRTAFSASGKPSPLNLYTSIYGESLFSVLFLKESTLGPLSIEGFFGFSNEHDSLMNSIFLDGYAIKIPRKEIDSMTRTIRKDLGNSSGALNKMPIVFCLNIAHAMIHLTGKFSAITDNVTWTVSKRTMVFLLMKEPLFISSCETGSDEDFGFLSRSEIQDGNFKAISQIDNLFILATIGGGLYVMDQHACDERITVEALTNEYIEQLLDDQCDLRVRCEEPVTFRLSITQKNIAIENHRLLSLWGIDFQIEEDLIIVTHLPRFLQTNTEAKVIWSCFVQCLHHLGEKGVLKSNSSHLPNNKIAHMKKLPSALNEAMNNRACRSSVKFGQSLNSQESTSLLTALADCENPFQCAHGRPTLVPLRMPHHLGNFQRDYEL